MYMMWQVDKYKTTFKLVTSSRRIFRGPAVEKHCYRELLRVELWYALIQRTRQAIYVQRNNVVRSCNHCCSG